MFSGTILDNITLFNYDITKERVIKVCKTVGIHDDIMNLEMGYNTFMVRKEFHYQVDKYKNWNCKSTFKECGCIFM